MACRAAWDTPNLASVVLCLSRKCTCNLFCTILVSISLAPAHQHSTALSEEAPDESFNANLFAIVVIASLASLKAVVLECLPW